MPRSKYCFVVVSALLGLALTGCGQDSSSSEGGKTFKFAVVSESTGAFGPSGSQLNAGVKAAVKDLNASGDYDFKLEPVFLDCQSDQAICVSKTRQAITTQKLPVVLGPVISLDVLPSAEVTQRANVAHIVFTPLSAITDKYTNTFRWAAQSDTSNQAVVDFVKAKIKPNETVALVHANTDFGNGGAELQTKQLEKVGITPVTTIGHDPEQADYTPVMVKLQKLDPTYVLLNDSNPADVAKLLRQAKEVGLTSKWVGADAAGSIKLAGSAANGFATVAPWFPNNTVDPKSTELTKKLVAEGVTDPGWIAAMAYDATKGVAEAAKAKGFSAKAMMSGLSSLSNMPGTAVNSWTFSKTNRVGLTNSTVADWTGDTYQAIWPEK